MEKSQTLECIIVFVILGATKNLGITNKNAKYRVTSRCSG